MKILETITVEDTIHIITILMQKHDDNIMSLAKKAQNEISPIHIGDNRKAQSMEQQAITMPHGAHRKLVKIKQT